MPSDPNLAAPSALALPVLTADAMRTADRFTIEEFGIPGFTLMESAGRCAADAIERAYGPVTGKRVACLCGKGNNGGDGFVVARVLLARGARLQVYTTGDAGEMREEAAQNLRLLEKLAARLPDHMLALHRFTGIRQLAAAAAPDLYVDALLGTGLTKELREPIRSLVDWLNTQPQPCIALDLPTGLHTDTGEVLGACVKADLTVTMAALKAGLLLHDGPDHAGRIEIAEIGIPGFAIEQAINTAGPTHLTTDALVRAWLPRRSHQAHKYSVGMALVVAGSPGLTGAPVMASSAAARSGAGAVVCACQEKVQPVLATKMTEVMTLALPESNGGGIDPERALETLKSRMEQSRALLVGPGLGRHPDTQQFVRQLLWQTDLPVVIDADGLNALVGHTDLLSGRAGGNQVLTPHAGEFKRLAGGEVDLSNRIAVVRAHAQQWNCVLVMKGMPSITGLPDGRVYVNGTGNPALATAGSGDILAGMCAGLLAQGLSAEQAAVCALHLGGAAADRYRRTQNERTMLAMDLLDQLPHVLKERFNDL